jgi:hypothetical protein
MGVDVGLLVCVFSIPRGGAGGADTADTADAEPKIDQQPDR